MATSMVHFVQTIEKYPCLYNYTLSDYSRKNVTDKAWSEVSQKTKFSVSDCQTKWKNIRNGFIRSLKPDPSGTGTKQRKLYYLHDEMQFILPFIKAVIHTEEVNSISTPQQVVSANISAESNSSTDEEQFQEPASNTPKRPKIRKASSETEKSFMDWIRTKIPENDNPRKMFLLSLLPDIDNLSDEQMRSFRIKVLLLLEEIRTDPTQKLVASQ